jgi:hypothetical protein
LTLRRHRNHKYPDNPDAKNMDDRTQDHEERIAALENKVQELEALVNISLRLSAAEKPISALLSRFGATEAETLAVHALLDDVLKRVQAGSFYTPSFAGFFRDLCKICPTARDDRQFVALLLDTLKVDRPSYQQLHVFVTEQGWPDWR